MTPENPPKGYLDCPRCDNHFEAQSVPAECPQCGTTVTRRTPVEATPAELLAERFRLAARRAKGNF
jgi:hypothetical protein